MVSEKSGEFRGKTVEAAINNGLAELRLSRDEVEIEVVRPGSRGLLGIGAEDAVVRLTAVKRGKPEPRPEPRQEAQPQRRAEPAPAAAARVEAKPEPRVEPIVPAPTPAPKVEAPVAAPVDMDVDPKMMETMQRGQEILAGLLERMGLQAEVEIVPQSEAESAEGERSLVLNIVGNDLGVLIGRQSEVLSALQFITRLMVNQQSRSRSNLIIDVNGYKAKRAESLRKLALRTAEQVMQTGRTMALEPMTPAERRIIHLTLREHPSVATESTGEGNRRKVTVVPKKE